MSKKLIAVCAAAVAFAACDETKPVVVSKPTALERRGPPATPVASAGLAVAKTGRDAGAHVTTVEVTTPVTVVGALPPEPVPTDVLALAHDTPTVDHLERAKQLLRDEELTGALAEARRAVFTTPSDEEAIELIAKVSRRVGKPVLSAQAWERLATFRPADATPSVQQARALFVAKDYPGMVRAGREAISRDSENAEAYHLTGLGLLSQGELAGAITNFERAVAIAPEHGYALNNLGLCYLRSNQNSQALDALERAAHVLPNVAYVQNNYGVALERMGEFDEAKVAYQHAMDLSPKYVKARLNAARVAKAQLGLPDEDEGPCDGETSPTEDVHPLQE